MSRPAPAGWNAQDAVGLELAIVVGSSQPEICQQLAEQALATAAHYGAKASTVTVASSDQLPVIVRALVQRCDGVVVVDCLTDDAATGPGTAAQRGLVLWEKVQQVALDYEAALGYGIISAETVAQARDLAGFEQSRVNTGAQATVAALKTAVQLRDIIKIYPQHRYRS